ncbi:unnamed protein product [Spodoptera littoralis]|uniref:Uncharacterized protein n=1 Tax=Spodoptera littoralis TaxID=7109 RepID=A0A9P0N3T6_SPOLI|nr:unnamed protein product [Spodoptera littoralis]CAH1640509.1 unnamed protein product [Spodoptera littoralis]
MQAAPARYVSVSELYSTDEVELLLDEIRELEPTSCRGEDVQDFEIAGSGCGAGAGGRSPAGTELTERSWDSHAQYRRAPPPRPRALAPLYCRLRHLLTPRGAASLLLLLCCGAACCCVWAGAGRAARLPHAARLRLLLLAALSSLLLHAALLALHVSRLHRLLPLAWDSVGAATSAWSAGSLALGGALTLHAVLAAPEYRWAPAPLARLLLAAAALALSGALVALALALGGARGWLRRRAAGAPGATYRAVPAAPGAAMASTSRDDPL